MTRYLDFLKYLEKSQPVFAPQARPSYSNVGYDLLGQVLVNVTGQDYETYITESILKPLKMTHTTFSKPDEANSVIPDGSQFDFDLSIANSYESPLCI